MDEHCSATDLHKNLPHEPRPGLKHTQRLCGAEHRHIHRPMYNPPFCSCSPLSLQESASLLPSSSTSPLPRRHPSRNRRSPATFGSSMHWPQWSWSTSQPTTSYLAPATSSLKYQWSCCWFSWPPHQQSRFTISSKIGLDLVGTSRGKFVNCCWWWRIKRRKRKGWRVRERRMTWQLRRKRHLQNFKFLKSNFKILQRNNPIYR